MLFEPSNLSEQKARIAVVGVGGAGGNALNRMIVSGLDKVEFIAVNTDAQDLDENNSQLKLQIGRELTKGLGAGANADVGWQAVEENRDVLVKAFTMLNSSDDIRLYIVGGNYEENDYY